MIEQSLLLDMLEEGEEAMAYKGFTIADVLGKRDCINISSFCSSSSQFSSEKCVKNSKNYLNKDSWRKYYRTC